MNTNWASKPAVIAKFQQHKTDTGSQVVQIALLEARIKQLAEHLKLHRKDIPTRRTLLKLVAKRRKLRRQIGTQTP